MSETFAASVHCLCNAVNISADTIQPHVGACHCKTCRTWGGGPFMELNCGANVEIAGDEHLKIYDSSEWAERGFCKNCGTHLFYRLKGTGEHMIPVGLFSDEAALEFGTEVFIDEKPSYYSFAEATEKLTGEELFAKFAPPE